MAMGSTYINTRKRRHRYQHQNSHSPHRSLLGKKKLATLLQVQQETPGIYAASKTIMNLCASRPVASELWRPLYFEANLSNELDDVTDTRLNAYNLTQRKKKNIGENPMVTERYLEVQEAGSLEVFIKNGHFPLHECTWPIFLRQRTKIMSVA